MNNHKNTQFFSKSRTWAIFVKEFTQMSRDRLTFMMLAMMPLLQLVLFGYAININPKHLPTTLIVNDNSPFVSQLVVGLQNTDYFQITHLAKNTKQADRLMQEGRTLFTLTIPPHFTHDLIRGKQPSLLLESDGSQGMAVSGASAAASTMSLSILNTMLTGPLSYLKQTNTPFTLINHLKYNPDNISSYAIVPGLLGVVLVMTMVMITSLSITRETERGTMESLLATPSRPLEVIIGKISPYIIVGYLQISIILACSVLLFSLPTQGHIYILLLCALPFIFSQLALGLMFSTIAKNQLQAVQMSFFWFLPNILLSGFMFPFDGMPDWAQYIGEVFPLTHFLTIIRSILLKGASWPELWPNIWPILIFATVIIIISMKRYRQTLG